MYTILRYVHFSSSPFLPPPGPVLSAVIVPREEDRRGRLIALNVNEYSKTWENNHNFDPEVTGELPFLDFFASSGD